MALDTLPCSFEHYPVCYNFLNPTHYLTVLTDYLAWYWTSDSVQWNNKLPSTCTTVSHCSVDGT